MSIYKVILLLALSVLQCSARPEPTDINNSDQLLFSPRIARQDGQSPISLPTLYQEWRNQSTEMVAWQLMLMFVTAGDGDDFYNLEVNLDDRSRRNIQDAVKMLLQFPTQEETEMVVNRVLVATVVELTNSSHLRHPLQVLGDQLDRRLREDPNLSSTYARLMATMHDSDATAPRKRYFNRVFNLGAGYLPFEPNYMKIPGNMRMMLRNGFREMLRQRTTRAHYYNVLANAIYNLGRKDAYAERLEQIREKVTDEMLTMMRKVQMVPFFCDVNPYAKKMLLKFERYINEQPDLRLELLKEKEAIDGRSWTKDLLGNLFDEFSFTTKVQKNIAT